MIPDEAIMKAIEEASRILGADPAYFGQEGADLVDEQLVILGYGQAVAIMKEERKANED